MYRLLLVEDDFLVRMVAKETLEQDGFVVLEAASAVEAIRILSERDQLDIVVTDVRMPGRQAARPPGRQAARPPGRQAARMVWMSLYTPAPGSRRFR
jgi:CheY-like chemotaxis protein